MDWYTPFEKQIKQHFQRIFKGQSSGHFAGQTLPRELIDHIEDTEGYSIMGSIFHEVMTLDLFGELRPSPHSGAIVEP
jgi:hypothetical protein